MKQVLIFDTTLRDGEQSPGATMNLAEKLEVAQALAQLGVDVIEAGFPVASPGDFEGVQAVARRVEGPSICALARCAPQDIAAAAEALRDAPKRRIHVFLATSPIHREHKLKMSRAQVVQRCIEGVERARALCDDVEFSAEDAARTEVDFLAEVFERAIEAGATTLNIPDTVGYTVPQAMGTIVATLNKTVRGIAAARLSVHCHNDLGLATANSLAALEAGARQVECTINGIGERAGNCALEEIVMALRTRHDHYGLTCGIKTERLFPTSRLLSKVTGLAVQRNKAIVGQNAFAHEAGIHQHGMLQHHSTYEIMRPADVGVPQTQLVLGKHSGRHAFRQRLEELGHSLDDVRLQRAFEAFKKLADKKKNIYDGDLETLVEAELDTAVEPGHERAAPAWSIVAVNTSGGSGTIPMAAVCLRRADGVQLNEAATGDGPIDAAFNAIARVTGLTLRLKDYQVRSVTVGTDSQGEAKVEVEHEGRSYRGRASSTDIIEASASAFVSAVNRIIREQKAAPQVASAGA